MTSSTPVSINISLRPPYQGSVGVPRNSEWLARITCYAATGTDKYGSIWSRELEVPGPGKDESPAVVLKALGEALVQILG